MIASQLNHQIYFIAEAPSNPVLNLPFKEVCSAVY